MAHQHKAHDIDIWFPSHARDRYVKQVVRKSDLTPTQSQYFVRLWGYGCLKQYGNEKIPISTLENDINPFLCPQREAADLFYGENQKTSSSARSMIDKFVKAGLVIRESARGDKTLITLNIPAVFEIQDSDRNRVDYSNKKYAYKEIYVTKFDIKNDRVAVANFVEEIFKFSYDVPDFMQKNIGDGLRNWYKRYPQGMRVMRCANSATLSEDYDDGKPEETIGFSAVFPVHPKSENMFYGSPRKSIHFIDFSPDKEDPIQYAEEGDGCTSAYIRGWQIKPEAWSYNSALTLLNDTQRNLSRMIEVYPELSDLYSIGIHPQLVRFALTIGFEILNRGNDKTLSWLFIPFDRFLKIDGEKALLNFDFNQVDFR